VVADPAPDASFDPSTVELVLPGAKVKVYSYAHAHESL